MAFIFAKAMRLVEEKDGLKGAALFFPFHHAVVGDM
jgi:hypothetical protein